MEGREKIFLFSSREENKKNPSPLPCSFCLLRCPAHRCPALCSPSSFSSFQTNKHRQSPPPPVYAAGNYSTAQFIKFGIPLQLLQFATVTLIFILRPWKWILCGASVLLLVAVVGALVVTRRNRPVEGGAA